MRHLGDICKIDGHSIEPVDVITFGAPCQDISVAGARKGIKHADHGDDETTRSGLFYEALRVIREMREGEKQRGRTTELIRPRYIVYENVGGLTSSNGGKDFQAVLTEIVKIVQPECPNVSMPENGKWGGRRRALWSGCGRLPLFRGLETPRRRLVGSSAKAQTLLCTR